VRATEVAIAESLIGDVNKAENSSIKFGVRIEPGVDERDDNATAREAGVCVRAERERKKGKLAAECIPEKP
jgi:hypothetical protein